MANLRKLLAIALSGASLAEDPNREVAVDRLRAHAHSDPLGAALWSLRWANNAGAYQEALRRLTERMTRTYKRQNRALMAKVCKVALDEWLRDVCSTCKGRRYIQATTTAAAHVCTVCEGSGLARISDQRRMRLTGMSAATYTHWERYFWLAHQRISEADTKTWIDVAGWLGRDIGQSAERKLLAIRRSQGTISHVSEEIDDFRAPNVTASAISDVPAQNANNRPGTTSTALPA